MSSPAPDLPVYPMPLERQAGPRKRPLRTYGRRANLTSDEPEPPRKKRATTSIRKPDDQNKENIPIESCPPSSPQLPKLPVPSTPKPVPVKRGSILSFFKPVPASSSQPQSRISSDSMGNDAIVSTPPSSPPSIPRPGRRRRRLMTRVGSAGEIHRDDPKSELEVDEDEHGQKAVEYEHRTLVENLKPSSLNGIVPTDIDTAEEGFKVKHKGKRRVRKSTVQTTLALSMKDDAGFTICKDCDMLYNPLNEKDRKDHARGHAAALRKKAGTVDV